MNINREVILNLDLETLLAVAEQLAWKTAGGHLTIFRFSGHWKCTLGTPCLDSEEGRAQVDQLKGFPTLREALLDLIIEKREPIG